MAGSDGTPHTDSSTAEKIRETDGSAPRARSVLARRILLVAAVYLIAALAARPLALPPGYASPLWPAAGLMVAALLLWGPRVWPGVWLGAFLATPALDTSLPGLAVAASLATGAALQTLIATWLTRPLLDRNPPLAADGDVGRFLLLAGPLACLIEPALGTATLYGVGRIAAAEWVDQWFAWWAGNTLGVLLFAPLGLLAWPGERPFRLRDGARIALPLIVTPILLAAGYLGLQHMEQQRSRQQLVALMDEAYETGLPALSVHLESLRGIERFFAASDGVTRADFAAFTHDIARRRGTVALDWAPRVAHADLAHFEAWARRDGPGGYVVFDLDARGLPVPSALRAEHFPVLYSEPEARNVATIGLDHGFQASRRLAMERARDGGKMAASSLVPLLRTPQDAWLVFLPVYRPGFAAKWGSVEARREALRGFVVGVFDLKELFAPLARAAESRKLAYRVVDVTPGEPAQALLGTASGTAPWSRKVEFAGRTLRIDLEPNGARRLTGIALESRLYLGFSVLVALLTAFASLAAAGRMAATEAQVTERTADLSRELAARHAAEAALREREQDLDITLQSIGDAVLTTDTEGRVTRMNPVAERLTGWPAAEARGRPVDEVFRIINEETRRPAVIPVEKVLRSGEIHGLANHTVLIARDGTERAIADSAAPIRDAGGQLRGVVLVFRDVSGERQAQAQLAQFFSLSLDMLCIAGADGYFKRISPAFSRTLGWSEEELLSRPILDFVHPDDRAATLHEIERQIASGENVLNFENRYRHKDGSWRVLSWRSTPHDKSLMFATARDVTDRKQLVEELIQARSEAEQASRAKSAFLATMSHEIRTPMNGVIGIVDVLAHTRLTEHQAELVKTIRESAATLLSLIDDILDFSKIEAGRLEIEWTPLSVTSLVEGLCNSLVPVAMRRGVDLDLFVSPEIPALVMSDDVRLRQVLYNLVGNAIKFSGGRPGRRGRVSIRAEVAQAEPLRLTFSVADNGIGMGPEVLDNLFTPFTQAEISTTRRFGGSGLGLAICRRLVDLMGGEIAVQSAPGTGSAFTVTLPFERAPRQPAAVEPDLSGIDCILVRQGELPAADLRVYLEHAGARVVIAANAAEAAQAARAMDPARPVVVIQDQGHRRPPPETFEASPNLRLLLLARGRRRRARVETSGAVTLDGDALRRAALLRAVAVAAGRASPEIFHEDTETEALGDAPPPSVAEARAQGRLILVVEDDEINRKVILQQLALLGHAAEVARDGEEALGMWRDGHPALILTDLHMPRMDGYTLAAAIRREERGRGRIPILALTANAVRGEASRARAAGIDEYLTKPIQLHLLRAAIEKWLPPPSAPVAAPAVSPAAPPAATPPLVDVAVLKRLVGDDPATVREFLAQFLEVSGRVGGELREAFAVGDLVLAGGLAHRLKSSARSVGALPLGELCAELEKAALSGDARGTAQCMTRFGHALAAAQATIAGMLSEQQEPGARHENPAR